MNIEIDKNETYNHYDCSSNELFKVLKHSILILDKLYSKLDTLDVTTEEKQCIYNIIDILYNMKLKEDTDKLDITTDRKHKLGEIAYNYCNDISNDSELSFIIKVMIDIFNDRTIQTK